MPGSGPGVPEETGPKWLWWGKLCRTCRVWGFGGGEWGYQNEDERNIWYACECYHRESFTGLGRSAGSYLHGGGLYGDTVVLVTSAPRFFFLVCRCSSVVLVSNISTPVFVPARAFLHTHTTCMLLDVFDLHAKARSKPCSVLVVCVFGGAGERFKLYSWVPTFVLNRVNA